MKQGDLVKFHTDSWIMQRDDYSNPGVIIEVQGRGGRLGPNPVMRYRVMWADQKITVESACYLKVINNADLF
jgi:hypothetical protein